MDLSVSVVTSAGEERLGVAHVYAWDVMGFQSHANAQISQSADAPAAGESCKCGPSSTRTCSCLLTPFQLNLLLLGCHLPKTFRFQLKIQKFHLIRITN